MTVLYDPERHEPLAELAWSEAGARDAIAAICREVEPAFAGDRLWPMHPEDYEPGTPADGILRGLYLPVPWHGRQRLRVPRLFARTRGERWLERARAFAMHATAQVARLGALSGRGRYTLFTGDPGAALLAAACITPNPAFPGIDDL
jgi:hypothetical protein